MTLKRIFAIFLVLFLIPVGMAFGNEPEQTEENEYEYTPGLLFGKIGTYGNGTTTTAITDGSNSTNISHLERNGGYNFYFNEPVNIHSYYTYIRSNGNAPSAKFYNADGNLVLTLSNINGTGALRELGSPLENITRIQLINAPGFWTYYSSFEVYGTVLEPEPEPTVKAVVYDPTSLDFDTLGAQLPITITAQYSDATSLDVTAEATWTSENPEVASVEAGIVTSIGRGSTLIIAEYAGHTITVTVTVNTETEPEPVPDNSNVELDLLTQSNTVNAAEEFTVDVTLNNATDIYAEDIHVSYDTNLFEFVHSDVGSAGLYLYHKVETMDGSLRYIVASQGEQYGISGNEIIVRLTFRAKNVGGTGNIDITSGLVADNLGNEYTPILNSTSITVQAMNADVNRNGFVSLGDLAIAAYDYSKTAGQLANENSDVNLDEVVNDIDLNAIVDAILANE